MDIQTLVTAISQRKFQEEAAVKVEKMSLNFAEMQGEALLKMLSSARTAPIIDPQMGNYLNFFM